MANVDLKNPAVQKLVLSVALAGALVFLFFFTHFVPFGYPVQQEKLNTLKAEYERKSTDLARARTTVADLPRFEAEYAHLHERWAMAAELLPTDHQLPALLRKITLAGEQTGVEFLVFRPNDLKNEQHYTEMPLQISVFGDYHQIGSFVAELANMRRIITVANLQLKSNTRGDTPSTTAAEFTASAYSLNTESETTPASTTAPAKGGESHARKAS